MFCVSHGCQGIIFWRFKQEDFNKECLKRSVEFAISVMTAQGPGALRIISTKVNSEVYQEILEPFIIPSSDDLCDDDFVFQQTCFDH